VQKGPIKNDTGQGGASQNPKNARINPSINATRSSTENQSQASKAPSALFTARMAKGKGWPEAYDFIIACEPVTQRGGSGAYLFLDEPFGHEIVQRLLQWVSLVDGDVGGWL
jgi:hypothetical protein